MYPTRAFISSIRAIHRPHIARAFPQRTSMSTTAFPTLDSYSTAVVLVPPPHLQHAFNLLRSANDKSYPRWTAHITLLFPFVHPSSLAEATTRLRDAVATASHTQFPLCLDRVDKFSNRSYNTVYLAPSEAASVQALWKTLASAAGYKGRPFAPHLTLGQAHAPWQLGFLQDKGATLLRNYGLVEWSAGSIVMLRKDEADGGLMKIYDEISLGSDAFSSTTIIPAAPLTYDIASGDLRHMLPASLDLPDGRLRLTTLNVLSDDAHPPTDRFALLKRDLLARTSHVVCLQEVPDALLPLLLGDEDVRARFAHCTHTPASVLPSRQNIVVLSTSGLPFTWRAVPLGENKHKPALVLVFGGAEQDEAARRVVLAVVHLTAGHEAALVAKREGELATLLSHLQINYPEDAWIIAGDSNMNVDALPSAYAGVLDDAWAAMYPNGADRDIGLTYEPARNTLAAETVKLVKESFRYDRVLLRKDGGLRAVEMEVLRAGPGDMSASDHWALHIVLDTTAMSTAGLSLTKPTAAVAQEAATRAPPSSKDTAATEEDWAPEDHRLEEDVRTAGGFPSPQQDATRTRAFDVLRMALAGAAPLSSEVPAKQRPPALPAGVKLVLELVGSRALGADTAASDLDVLAVGNLGQSTFFALARARIRAWQRVCDADGGTPVVLKRFVRDAAVPMMRLSVAGVEIDLQYAPAAKVVERWSDVPSLASDDPLFLLPAGTLRTLNAHRDNLRLRTLFSDARWPTFRLALRALKVFADSRGLSGARFGFLGGVHLTIMLARAMLDAPPAESHPMDVLHAFIARYATFDWTAEPLSVPGGGTAAGTTYRRMPREALAILSIERPVLNVAAAATPANVSALRAELGRAQNTLGRGGSWADVCTSPTAAANEFLRAHQAFVRLDVSFWGGDPVRGRALLGYVESRLVRLLLDLGQLLPGSHPRLWPRPFSDDSSSFASDHTISICYLIGTSSEAALDALQRAPSLHDFERSVTEHEGYYDPAEAYVGVTAVDRTEVAGLELLTSPLAWSDGGVDADDGNDDDDAPTAPSSGANTGEATYIERSLDDFLSAGRAPARPAARTQAPGGRLRTSADVYNRLMWDASADSADYIVGYEDRFEGIMETPLLSFKREVEDEAFVPFHRVEYFRRKSDGLRVWDRKTRVDLVFGSGNAPASIS